MYSFEIFDVVIESPVNSHRNLFLLVEKELQQNQIYANMPARIKKCFAMLRDAAEKNAVLFFHEKQQVVLEDIYYVFSSMTGCSLQEQQQIMELELSLVENNVVPIDENINRIKELVQAGEKVVLISDTCLPECTLRCWLTQLDGVFETIPIYASSTYNALKKTGELFLEIKKNEKLPYEAWWHIGSDRISDYLVPRQLGIHASLWEPLLKEKFDAFELEAVHAAEEALLAQLDYECQQSVKEISGGECAGLYAGVLFFDFIRWVIGIASRKSIEKLCFLARDGFVLKKIADIIIKEMHLDLKTEYVYCSRTAWKGETPEQRKAIQGYMKTIAGDGEQIAFVDLQASGNSLKRMEKICGYDAYYFCFNMISEGTRNNCKWFLYTDIVKSLGCIEVLCRAPHGATIGYELKGERWEPVLGAFKCSEWQQREFNAYIDMICKVCRRLLFIEKNKHVELNFYYARESLLSKIWVDPSEKIADFIGDVIHTDDNDDRKKFAPKLSKEQILRCIHNEEKYEGTSIDYTIKRLPRKDRACIEQELFKVRSVSKSASDLDLARLFATKRIIVYGAGRVGKRLVKSINDINPCAQISWVDMDWEAKQKEALPVVSLKKALEQEYDCLYLAIAEGKEKMKKYLVACGVDESKIIMNLDEALKLAS